MASQLARLIAVLCWPCTASASTHAPLEGAGAPPAPHGSYSALSCRWPSAAPAPASDSAPGTA